MPSMIDQSSASASRYGIISGYIERHLERSGIFFAVLIGLFALSFAVPLIFAVRMLGHPAESALVVTEEDAPQLESVDRLFPSAIKASSSNKLLRIPSVLGVEPAADGDFIIVTWINLSRIPKDRERMVIFEKMDSQSANQPGYALALLGERDVVRPQAYLRDRNGDGRWMSFAELPVLPHTWIMLALSVSKGQLVGLHAGLPLPGIDKYEVKLLGGADLEKPIIPAVQNDLLVGAVPQSRFRGMIGGVGILTPENLHGDMKNLMKDLVKQPFQIPSDIDSDDVMVWYGFGSDLSQNQGPGIVVETPVRGAGNRGAKE